MESSCVWEPRTLITAPEVSVNQPILQTSKLRVRASLVAQSVKNPPAMQETQVQSLCPEDPLEEGMATHFSILAWRIPWTGEPGELQSMVLQESDTT